MYPKPFDTQASHYIHKRVLLKAIKKLGYKVYFKTSISHSDIFTQSYTVDFAIENGSPYKIGFIRSLTMYYKIIGDWDGLNRTSLQSSSTILHDLEQEYDRINKKKFIFNKLIDSLILKVLSCKHLIKSSNIFFFFKKLKYRW